MPRRRVVAKREVLPDPKFGNEQLTRFINVLMVDGKKSIAEKVVYGALDIVGQRLATQAKEDGLLDAEDSNSTEGSIGLKVFLTAVENIVPSVEVRSRRVGGATYQVPVEVPRDRRGLPLAYRWVIDAARKRSEKGMGSRLAGELVDAYNKRGNAMKKREDTHRMADANKAFAHFRW